MSRVVFLFSCLAVLTAAVCLSGCGSSDKNKDTKSSGSNGDDHKGGDDHEGHGDHKGGDDHEGHGAHAGGDDHANHGSHGKADPAKIEANLAKLSAEDRVLAEKQKMCPVTEDPLGAMGVPIKLDVKGQTVFLCCKGCKDDFENEPDEYLAKLKQHAEHGHKGHDHKEK